MHQLLDWTTGLGDAALLLPGSIGVLAHLLHRRSTRGAISWATSLLLSIGVTIVLKLCFHACGGAIPFLDIQSPSGHVSFATTFYLSAGMAVSAQRPPWMRAAILLAAAGLVVAVAASRVALHVHTLSEVVAGGAIGLAGAARFAMRDRAVTIDWRAIAGPFLLLALMSHGWHLGIEAMISDMATGLRGAVPVCSPAGEWPAPASGLWSRIAAATPTAIGDEPIGAGVSPGW